MQHNTIIKIVILAFIIAVPFVDYKYLQFFDSIAAKIVMLAIIAAFSFYNMEIAVLVMILFFLMIISSNNVVLKATKPKENFIMSEFPDTQCTPAPTEVPNPYSFFIDDKIKPYEEYIKQIGYPADA